MACLYFITAQSEVGYLDLMAARTDIAVRDEGAVICDPVKPNSGQMLSLTFSNSGCVLQPGTRVLHHADDFTVGNVHFLFSEGTEPQKGMATGGPAPFIPVVKEPSIGERFLWPFTAMGRARHALRRSLQAPENTEYYDAVARAVKALYPKCSVNAECSGLRAELLAFLVWKSVSRSDLSQAVKWLEIMDADHPLCPARQILRWDLMRAFAALRDLNAYYVQARLLFSSPEIISNRWRGAVLDSIARIYEQVSPEAVEQLLSGAPGGMKSLPEVAATVAVCSFPVGGCDIKQAKEWAARIRPDLLTFSARVRADACIALSRIAEINGEFSLMLKQSIDAFRSAPSYGPSAYWVCRSRLQCRQRNPDAHLSAALRSGADWQRLAALLDLYRNPGLTTASRIPGLLAGVHGSMDASEQKLAVALTKQALEGFDPIELEDIKRAAAVCQSLEDKIGSFSWTSTHIARQEITCDAKYVPAYSRLEKNGSTAQRVGAELARVARLLAGSPLKRPAGTGDLASWLEAALFHLFESQTKLVPVTMPPQSAEDAQLLRRFPRLREASDAVSFVLSVLKTNKASDPPSLSTAAPTWSHWVVFRAELIRSKTTIVTQAPMAWSAEFWACNHAYTEQAPVLLHLSAPILEKWVANQNAEVQAPLKLLRSIRLRSFKSSHGNGAPIEHLFPELGAVAETAALKEAAFERNYASGRALLANHEEMRALQVFQKLESDVAQAGALVRASWMPIVQYWRGASQASSDPAEAFQVWESLLETSKKSEARGQLAMLALSRNEIEQARIVLAEAPLNVPGCRYAQGLLYARTLDFESMRNCLRSEEAKMVLADSCYDSAARKLLAVTEERNGHRNEAQALYEEGLKTDGEEPVVQVRLARCRLRSAYDNLSTEPLGNLHMRIPPLPAGSATWSSEYVLLARLLSAPVEQLTELVAAGFDDSGKKPGRVYARMQACVWRMLILDRPEMAAAFIASRKLTAAPGWFERTRSILTAWKAMTAVGTKHSDCATALRRSTLLLASLDTDSADDELRSWHSLTQKCSAILTAGSDVVGPFDWPDLQSHPLRQVAAMWSENQRQGTAAASAIMSLLNSKTSWSESQRLLLKAISAWIAGQDDVYLETYPYLEPVLDELPVPGPELWICNALIRFARRDWKYLLEAEMPDCVAELQDERVKTLIGCAFARAAADECVQGDPRMALKHLRQAQNALAPLLHDDISREKSQCYSTSKA